MMSDRCPEALYGHHGEPNSSGKCPYCSTKIASTHYKYPSRERGGRGHSSLSQQQLEWIDAPERQRDHDGLRYIPVEQDPEIDPDRDDSIYD